MHYMRIIVAYIESVLNTQRKLHW